MAAILLKTVKVTAQVGVPLGAVYYTASNDIWSTDNTKSSKTVNQLKDYVYQDMKSEKQEPATDYTNLAANMYNSGVKKVFYGFSKTPETVVDLASKTPEKARVLSQEVSRYLQSPSSGEKS